jgi:hypothetical protein
MSWMRGTDGHHVCGFCGLPIQDSEEVGFSYPDENDEVTPYHDPICWYYAHFGTSEYNIFYHDPFWFVPARLKG